MISARIDDEVATDEGTRQADQQETVRQSTQTQGLRGCSSVPARIHRSSKGNRAVQRFFENRNCQAAQATKAGQRTSSQALRAANPGNRFGELWDERQRDD